MPLNVRRFFASVTLVSSGFIVASSAQTAPPSNTAPANSPVAAKPAAAPTSAEIMRERISKAKAFIAVKNFNAAIYELENIRRETGDQTVHGVINVLLMNSYLEQGDYTRAQNFLKELAGSSKTAKPSPFYFAVAGQVVKGARNQLERYRALGLTVSDRSLPLEASVDVEKMRETLETVIEQSKTIGTDKAKAADAMPLLEEAIVSRANLARDDYDANRWKNSVAETREQMAGSRTVIVNAVNVPSGDGASSADALASAAPVVNTETASAKPEQTAQLFKPVAADATNDKIAAPKTTPAAGNVAGNTANNAANNDSGVKETPSEEIKKPTETVKPNETPRPNVSTETAQNAASRNRRAETAENKVPEKKLEPVAAQTTPAPVENTDNTPLQVGSLVSYATSQAKPVYPIAAKNMRMTGVVKVEVVVNEDGEVAEVQGATGPSMLQRAALDAVKKWKFKPFVRAGQPTKASGFVSFNFSL